MSADDITIERLRALLDYEPATGHFLWKVRRNAFRGAVNPGSIAGFVDASTGYVRIGIDGRHYLAHRLAWFFTHGRWPAGEIDHANRNRADNSLGNLREATRSENAHNTPRRADNTSGYRGVHWAPKQRRWYARIAVDGVTRSLGGHASAEAAAAAYAEAAKHYYGEFARS